MIGAIGAGRTDPDASRGTATGTAPPRDLSLRAACAEGRRGTALAAGGRVLSLSLSLRREAAAADVSGSWPPLPSRRRPRPEIVADVLGGRAPSRDDRSLLRRDGPLPSPGGEGRQRLLPLWLCCC